MKRFTQKLPLPLDKNKIILSLSSMLYINTHVRERRKRMVRKEGNLLSLHFQKGRTRRVAKAINVCLYWRASAQGWTFSCTQKYSSFSSSYSDIKREELGRSKKWNRWERGAASKRYFFLLIFFFVFHAAGCWMIFLYGSSSKHSC